MTKVHFCGYEWQVRNATNKSPGPNNWIDDNVSVDTDGLHLKISKTGDIWSCALVSMKPTSLGFGTYEWEVAGTSKRLDQLDCNVGLGLFNYGGKDRVDEIDIECGQWGDNHNQNRLRWVVYPAKPDNYPATPVPQEAKRFVPLELPGNATTVTTHIFDWKSRSVNFQCYHEGTKFKPWMYPDPHSKEADDPTTYIPQNELPVKMCLFLIKGAPPTDGQPVEVVIRSFKFKKHCTVA